MHAAEPVPIHEPEHLRFIDRSRVFYADVGLCCAVLFFAECVKCAFLGVVAAKAHHFDMVVDEKAIRIAARIQDRRSHKRNVTEIADVVGCSRPSVRRVLNGIAVKKRQAKKRQQRDKLIVKLAQQLQRKEHRTFPKYGSSARIAEGLKREHNVKLSARQVCRVLRASDLKPYKRTKVPCRGIEEVRARRAFARKLLRTYKKKDFSSLVFSDETWLTCNEATCSHQWAKRKADVQPLESKNRWNVPSVLIWGAIGVGWRSPLIIFPAKHLDEEGEKKSFRLDASRYIKRCLSRVVGDIVNKKKTFQQDGASCHKAKSVHAYLKRKKCSVLVGWPAYSPDLSPIESFWAYLKREVGLRCPMTIAELQRVAQQVWNEIPQSELDAAVLSFKGRLQGVMRRKCD